MSLFKNIKKRGLKDVLRPRKWGIFIRYLRSKFRPLDGWQGRDPLIEEQVPETEFDIDPKILREYTELTTPHELEQIAWRMSFSQCKPCLEKGECVHCGCKSPELFYDRNNECSAMSWYQMYDRKTWEELKDFDSTTYEVNPDYIEQIKKHGRIINF